MADDVERLRAVARWADWQYEDYWYPTNRPPRTMAQVCEAYDLCQRFGVDVLEDLLDGVEDPEAWQAWRDWMEAPRLDPDGLKAQLAYLLERVEQGSAEEFSDDVNAIGGLVEDFLDTYERWLSDHWVEPVRELQQLAEELVDDAAGSSVCDRGDWVGELEGLLDKVPWEREGTTNSWDVVLHLKQAGAPGLLMQLARPEFRDAGLVLFRADGPFCEQTHSLDQPLVRVEAWVSPNQYVYWLPVPGTLATGEDPERPVSSLREVLAACDAAEVTHPALRALAAR